MAVTTGQFLEIVDRLAKQRDLIGDVVDSANVADGSGRKFWEDVLQTDDHDFINRLIKTSKELDSTLTRDHILGTETPATVTAARFPWFRPIVNSIADWLNFDIEKNLDTYLTDNSIQVSEFFDELWYSVIRTHLDASNVFCEQVFNLGSVTIDSGPVLSFTDGERLGIGSGKSGGTGATRNFAPAQFKVVTVTEIGVSDLDIRCTLTKPDGSSEDKDIVIPSGSSIGTVVNIASSSDVYIDLTNVIYTPASDQGTSSDQFTINHIKPREIAL